VQRYLSGSGPLLRVPARVPALGSSAVPPGRPAGLALLGESEPSRKGVNGAYVPLVPLTNQGLQASVISAGGITHRF